MRKKINKNRKAWRLLPTTLVLATIGGLLLCEKVLTPAREQQKAAEKVSLPHDGAELKAQPNASAVSRSQEHVSTPRTVDAQEPKAVTLKIGDPKKAEEIAALVEYYKTKEEPDLRIKAAPIDNEDYSERSSSITADISFARVYIDYGRRDTDYLQSELAWVQATLHSMRSQRRDAQLADADPKLRGFEIRERAIQKLLDYRKDKLLAHKRMQSLHVETP